MFFALMCFYVKILRSALFKPDIIFSNYNLFLVLFFIKSFVILEFIICKHVAHCLPRYSYLFSRTYRHWEHRRMLRLFYKIITLHSFATSTYPHFETKWIHIFMQLCKITEEILVSMERKRT